jgi:serine/threonine protein kinase/Tfp pilus assembly protein PilF
MIGQTLSHYRILEKVASGGMGVVYRARDEQLEREVAIKVLPPGTLSDDGSRRRFRKEALALAKLSHPNIETIYEFDTQDGMDFLVMEYVAGKTLAETLANGPLPKKEVVAIGLQITAAMEEAHERGIVHRDLKPRNIAITGKGRAKVLDFGLAKLLPHASDLTAETLTETAAGAGTLPYMPPEQLDGEAVDERADIYTIGAVLYEMATDRRVFPEQLPSRVIDAILHRAPVAPRALNPGISPELERIILKCLDKDPGRRYQSAKELSVDLRRLSEPIPAPAIPASAPTESRRHYRLSVALVSLLVVMVVGTGYWFWARQHRAREAAVLNQNVRSIAVIPFRNTSVDKSYDYFGVGLADVLNAKMTDARILEVHAVPLPANPAESNTDPLQAGRKLGVDAVLSGSYQIEEGTLSLRYTLVDSRRGVQVAGKDFQVPFTRSIEAEHELAAEITDSLHGSVSSKDRARLTSASTEQNEAFQAYLRSSYEMEVFWRQPSAAQLDRAEQDLQEALRSDPRFGLALVSLARLHWLAAFWGYADDPRILDSAEHEANRAIELEPDSGEPYAALSLVQIQKGSIGDARKSIQAAFTRSRNSALAYYAAGLYYMTKGLALKSITCFQKAQQLNPELIRRELGLAYRSQGDFLRARDELRQDLDSHPNDRVTAAVLAGVLIGLDDIAGAQDIEETLLSHTPDDPTVRYVQALLLVREGKPFSIESWLLRYQKVYWVDPGYCFDVAAVYAAAQQPSSALHWLRRARELGATNYPFISQNPLFSSLRRDSAFQSFLESTERDWESANREEERDPLISGIFDPRPAAYSTVSFTPSRESSSSSFSSTNAAVQKGAKPSQVATKQNVWQKCPASNNTTRYALEKW